MSNYDYDSIIVGAGAGGAAAAFRLTAGGERVLLIEKGPRLACDAATRDPDVVLGQKRFQSHETWLDAAGYPVVPEEYFNVGGKTKWYGAALMRAADHEFERDPVTGDQSWPFGAAELAPWYTEAERLLGVRTFACEPGLRRLADGLARHGWQSQPLPLGLAEEIVADPDEASRFDGFASPRGLKSDVEVRLIEPALRSGRLTLITNTAVASLLPGSANPRVVNGVCTADLRIFRARRVLLAAGALHSPRILARFLAEHALSTLPIGAHVGRSLKLHLLTAMVTVGSRVQTDLLRKTTAFLHPAFPHSSVQPLGFDAELIARLIPALVPRPLARAVARRSYGFFLQTEDGAHVANRVYERPDGTPVIDYDTSRCAPLAAEHTRLVRQLRADLARAGCLAFAQRIGLSGTAHACGTLAAGTDPATSVVDGSGRVHGLDGLYVVDGSVLPRSARVNPSLTIVAWSLRVAARLAASVPCAA